MKASVQTNIATVCNNCQFTEFPSDNKNCKPSECDHIHFDSLQFFDKYKVSCSTLPIIQGPLPL